MAGIKKAVKEGKIKKGEVVVANITGTGKGRIEDDLLEISEEFGYKEKAEQLLKEVGAW